MILAKIKMNLKGGQHGLALLYFFGQLYTIEHSGDYGEMVHILVVEGTDLFSPGVLYFI